MPDADGDRTWRAREVQRLFFEALRLYVHSCTAAAWTEVRFEVRPDSTAAPHGVVESSRFQTSRTLGVFKTHWDALGTE